MWPAHECADRGTRARGVGTAPMAECTPHLWAGRSRLSPWQYVLSFGLAAAQKKGGPENKEV
jgi:hypothetical protein